ncbi:hypothetical protein ABIC28_005179 [Rhodococcus sp. PvR044]
MGMRFGSPADEPYEISEHHRAMIEEYFERHGTPEDVERMNAEESMGPPPEDID